MLRSLPDAIYLEKVCDLRSAEELCDLLSTASIRTMLRSSLSRATNLARTRGFKTEAYCQSPAAMQKVLDTFAKYKACAVLRTPKAEQCAPAMQAAIDGGFDVRSPASAASMSPSHRNMHTPDAHPL